MSIHAIKQYQTEIENIIDRGGTKKETAIRSAFFNLLNEYAKQKGLMLIAEVTIKTAKGKNVTPDGTLKDTLRQDWGYWESKDEADIIDDEIKKKFDKGYPNENILFEDSQTAVLIQNGQEVERVKMQNAEALDHIIHSFISFERPEVIHFRKAIELFKQDIPKVTDTLRDILDKEETTNPAFVKERDKFLKLCHDSINPDVTKADVREMMIQHILTEDIFNTIFDETQFHRENNIAHQLETVINTFFTGATKKTALSSIKHYYQAINAAAAGIADHHEKQNFLKVVYETFYKSYNPKAADRLGVVYTPNEIVRFMIDSTNYLLSKHFNKFLEDKGVEILDPATGTGTFICDIIDHIRKDKLEYKYRNELHANEVAILPYYISNLNIEFTYTQKMGKYAEFENLCFVDTLDNMGFKFRGKQFSLFEPFTAENSKRIHRQNTKNISVVIGNPPYNANQANENDNNKNKEYPEIDKRIKDTFIKYSTAQKTKVYDMYARFYRWAFDRLDNNGIVAFITNRSFIDSRTFDGFRKCVQDEFDYAYIIDTKSDVRANSKISGTAHNVFGIQTGVAIMLLVKKLKRDNNTCNIQYIALDDFWKKEQKLQWLSENSLKDIQFEHLQPSSKNNWINLADNDFESLIPLCSKDVKSGNSKKALFGLISNGIVTARDEWSYDFNKIHLSEKSKFFCEFYDNEQNRWNSSNRKTPINNFVKREIKFGSEIEAHLVKGDKLIFDAKNITTSHFRPFTKKYFYFDRIYTHRIYQLENIFGLNTSYKNKVITFLSIASSHPIYCLCSDTIFDAGLLKQGNGLTSSVSFFRYDASGNCVDNITDWGLNQFLKRYKAKANIQEKEMSSVKMDSYENNTSGRSPYPDLEQPHLSDNAASELHEPKKKYGLRISKEDIFHYTYAVLHNPAYRKKYELNLKREFPRIPFYDDFNKWSKWGKALMNLHINYETVKPYPLKLVATNDIENPKCKLKADKESGVIVSDENTTLTGVPVEAWNYKLGNRSALEWVLDQYKEKKPSDPTILEKFNTYKFADYKTQVIDLLKRVCTVSVETMEIIRAMNEMSE